LAVELSLWWGRESPVRSCDMSDRTTQQQAPVIVVFRSVKYISSLKNDCLVLCLLFAGVKIS